VIAMLQESVDVGSRLVKAGCDKELIDGGGKSILFHAVEQKDLDRVTFLCRFKVNLNCVERKYKRSPMHVAMKASEVGIVRALLRYSPDVYGRVGTSLLAQVLFMYISLIVELVPILLYSRTPKILSLLLTTLTYNYISGDFLSSPISRSWSLCLSVSVCLSVSLSLSMCISSASRHVISVSCRTHEDEHLSGRLHLVVVTSVCSCSKRCTVTSTSKRRMQAEVGVLCFILRFLFSCCTM
jgi:Ankyrin repeats (3 copies)